MLRIGFGYDIHQLATGRKLVLGGVNIKSKLGLLGHSDADALLHAICDAILGALALGDIGKHFPNTDKRFKNISSLELLTAVRKMMLEKHYDIVNIDSTVVLESPKLSPHIDKMRRRIGSTLKVAPACISIKATTNEGLDAIGSQKGCSASAVVLLESFGFPA